LRTTAYREDQKKDNSAMGQQIRRGRRGWKGDGGTLHDKEDEESDMSLGVKARILTPCSAISNVSVCDTR
jgi:hypothetical protein